MCLASRNSSSGLKPAKRRRVLDTAFHARQRPGDQLQRHERIARVGRLQGPGQLGRKTKPRVVRPMPQHDDDPVTLSTALVQPLPHQSRTDALVSKLGQHSYRRERQAIDPPPIGLDR